MFKGILEKYMNIFIIILYVYILFSYDFKENIQLLLVITGVFIYIIYMNGRKIIEGNTNIPPQGPEKIPITTTPEKIPITTPGTTPETTPDTTPDTTPETTPETTPDTTQVDEVLPLSALNDMDVNGDGLLTTDEINSGRDINIDTPNIPDIDIAVPDVDEIDVEIPDIVIPDIPLNLNLDLGDMALINNSTEITKLKERILELENKIDDLDEVENENVLIERIMDLESETKKWNETSIEGGLKDRKVRSRTSGGYKTTTGIGMYDNLCLDHLEKENTYTLADEDDVNTFLGTSIPLGIKNSNHSKLTGPPVDGLEGSRQRLNMFETNKTSISCCENSPFLSSNGCVCLTKDQEGYLMNRGGNHE
jgi:hypothetical protein